MDFTILSVLLSVLSIDMPAFPMGEHILPGSGIVPEQIIDISAYSDPLTDVMGRFSFSSIDTGEKWQLILVNKSNITILEEESEPRVIPYDFTADHYFLSGNGTYVVFTSTPTETEVNALRVNTLTGEEKLFICCPGLSYTSGSLIVSNSGSVVSWYNGSVYFFDNDLVQHGSTVMRWGFLNGTEDGSVVVLGFPGPSISAYDNLGNFLWNRSDFPEHEQTINVHISDVAEECCRVTDYICYRLDLETGETISSISSQDGYSFGFYSSEGSDLCFATKHRPFRNGSNQTTAHIELLGYRNSIPLTAPYDYNSDNGRRYIGPSACSDDLLLYQIYGSDEWALVLTDFHGNNMLTFRTERPEQYVSGSAYGSVHHRSFGEISDSSRRVCLYADSALHLYRIEE